MNFMMLIGRAWFLARCLMALAAMTAVSGWAGEYEVDLEVEPDDGPGQQGQRACLGLVHRVCQGLQLVN